MFKDQYLKFEQDISMSEWPYDIDLDYLEVAKPNGLLRTWFYSYYNRNAALLNITVTADFLNMGKVPQSKLIEGNSEQNYTFGGSESIRESDLTYNDFMETSYVVHSLDKLAFDTIRLVAVVHITLQ